VAIAHGVVSVTDAATLLSAAHDTERNIGAYTQTVLVQNPTGGESVFIGGSEVSTSDFGFELVSGSSISVDLQANDALYGIVSAGPQDVYCLYQGV
jgi:hypothetical protein